MHPSDLEVAIVGAGPAGIGTAVALERLDVEAVVDDGEGFVLETADGPIRARYVVWAAGQYQYPTRGAIDGETHGIHVADVDSWAAHVARVSNDDAAESGIDAALGLAEAGLSVTVLDTEGTWQFRSPDPNEVLSPRTNERLEAALDDGQPIDLVPETRVETIEPDDRGKGYVVTTTDGDRFRSRTSPILATGFAGSLSVVDDLFAFDGEFPRLTDRDESVETPGLFLVGPQVAHNGQQFCFIYKFRQRFAVVAEELGEQLGVETAPLEAYREKRMFLEDLECCEPDYCDC